MTRNLRGSPLTRHLSRRAFAGGAMAAGSLLVAGVARTRTVAAASFVAGDQVVTTDSVNYRSTPGIAADNILAVLPPGTSATIVALADASQAVHVWYEIELASGGDHPTGFVAGEFLALAGTSIFPVGSRIIVTTDLLNVRDQPGLDGVVVAVVANGATGTVAQKIVANDGYNWVQVDFADHSGWVATDFIAAWSGSSDGGGGGAAPFPVGSQVAVNTDALNVRSVAGLSGAVAGVVTAGTVGNVVGIGASSDGYDWIKVAFPGVQGWVAASLVVAWTPGGGDFAVDDWVVVASGPLNVRASAGLGGAILRALPTGATGLVVDGPAAADGYVWYQIEIDGGARGWVVQDFLAAGTPPPSGAGVQTGDTIKVVDGPLNIRSGPGSSYGVIDVAAAGATAAVVDGPQTADGYTWIKIDGNLLASGWVAFEFCQVV